MNQDLTSYYNYRAKEYDRVYLIPEEQDDLVKATAIFQQLFRQKQVLEIACGTGYWTEQIAATAFSILATDINASVVEIAKNRKQFDNVVFEVADMYSLSPKPTFNALFGGFIWSHILLQDLDIFLRKVVSFLQPGTTIAFIDSKPVENTLHSKKNITKTDEQGNTYQTRTLDDGTAHLVLKNFPTKEFLIQKLSPFSKQVEFIDLDNYWIVLCTLNIQ